jgi:hypothetical protein
MMIGDNQVILVVLFILESEFGCPYYSRILILKRELKLILKSSQKRLSQLDFMDELIKRLFK